jgi:hypothetical protein
LAKEIFHSKVSVDENEKHSCGGIAAAIYFLILLQSWKGTIKCSKSKEPPKGL